ncbi:hypothetical protein DL768_008966 [Monosporascus sp. mg162]|nr:hypothetical protein DL768_008966 [Monosporascus sp. mg162]
MEDLASLTPAQQEAFLNCPALAPPSGIRPDFDDPPGRKGQGLAIIVICGILSTSWTAIRAYSGGAYVCMLVSISEMLHAIGLLAHQWNIEVKQMERFLRVSVYQGASGTIHADLRQLLYLYMTMYCLRMMFAKSVILLE